MSLPINKTVAACLTLSLVISSLPGEALAQMVAGRGVSVPVVPNLAAPVVPHLVSPTLSPSPSLLAPVAPALKVSLQTAIPVAPRAFAAPRTAVASAQAVAQAAPAAAKDRSVLGTLRAAVSGLVKAAGLSGAGLKTEAGRSFEGPSRYFSGAVPASFNGVDSPGGRGLVPYGPTPEQARIIEGHIRSSLGAGDLIRPLEAAALGKRAGLDTGSTMKVLGGLADRGLLLAYANAHFSVVMWHPSDQGESASFNAALSHARTGVERANRDGFVDHAKAIASFDEAASRLKSLPGFAARENKKLVEVLRANAALELMRDVTKDLETQLTTRAQAGRVAQTLAVVRRVSSWLGTAAMAPGKMPSIDPSLSSDLKKLADSVDAAKRESGPNGVEVASGIRTMQAIIASLHGASTPKPVASTGQAVPVKPGSTPNLDKYGLNLTAKAAEGRLTPMIGRKAELRQMIKTLMRVEKNNPVVIGEKGVGKTKVVEGLAQLIADGKVPELAGVNIIKLDVTALVAGTQYRGQFEERLKGVMDEAKANKGKVLLFIDELHTIVGLGSAAGSQDASQMLKEALSSGDLSLIGATTLEEYRKIEKDGALERRFNPIKLAEPTQEEAIEILEGTKSRFEKKHGVSIPRATSEAAVRLAARYVKSRSLPDSALDLLDDASAEVALQNSEAKAAGKEGRTEVTVDDVATEIGLRTGIPAKDLSEDDLASLKRLPEELKTRVIGQDEAVEAVAKAIRRGRLGYREEKAPIGTFMFLGPTGVGKTEFVRVLAKNQYGSEKNIVRIDMSEYQEKHSVSRLVGAPPGYVGFESAGQLTEAVRRNPHTLVLFDEIEKAAPEVLDVLLQVIEDGRLTDGQGRVVDFSNAIIVMTSNIGGSLAAERAKPRRSIGFIQPSEPEAEQAADRAESYIAAFKAKVRPEFYNRIGKRRVVVFNELGSSEMGKILDLRLAELNERVASKGMAVRLSEAARKHILDEATSAENRAYGARPLKQAVAHEVEDALVDGELDGAIKKGDSVLVDFDGTRLTVQKDPEAEATKLGGFALPALAGAALAGTQLHLALAGAALIGAGIGYVLASAVYRRVLAGYRRKHGIPEPPKKFKGFDAGVVGGLLGGALAPWLWGMAPIQAAIPALTLGSIGILTVGVAVAALHGVLRALRWLVRAVSRRGPPPEAAPRKLSRRAKAAIVAVGLAVGLTAGVVPHGASAGLQQQAAALVAPQRQVNALPAPFRDEVLKQMQANAEGRRILDALRDRGGVVRMPNMLMMVEDTGVGAHYLSLLDHMSIPVERVTEKGWTVKDFLASPEKQRQLASEMAPTIAHELRHRAQYLRSILTPGVIMGGAIEFEWEAYLSGHDFIHEALKADPHAQLDGGDLYDYESFLDGYDKYLENIEKEDIYADNQRVGGKLFNEYFAARRTGWAKHAAEGYRLLAERNSSNAYLQKHYLEKAAKAEK